MYLRLGTPSKLANSQLITQQYSSQEDIVRMENLSREICHVQGLANSFQPILSVVLRALDAPVIFMRTKALRALSQIVGSDQSVLARVGLY